LTPTIVGLQFGRGSFGQFYLAYAMVTTAIRRPFDCLSKVIKVTVTAVLTLTHTQVGLYGLNVGCRMVV